MAKHWQRLKEAYREAKAAQPTARPKLREITLNQQTKEFTFHWQAPEK